MHNRYRYRNTTPYHPPRQAIHTDPKMPSELQDKNGEPIKKGDHVFARARGGSHEGNVEKIVTSKEEAEEEGVKHPPKVCKQISMPLTQRQS